MHISISIYLDIYIIYNQIYTTTTTNNKQTIVPIFKHKSNLQKSVEKINKKLIQKYGNKHNKHEKWLRRINALQTHYVHK